MLGLIAVAADGLDRTTFHSLLALGFFFGGGGLAINVGVAPIIVAGEIGGRRFPAKIAIDALIIYVIFPGNVIRVSIGNISHIFEIFVPIIYGPRVPKDQVQLDYLVARGQGVAGGPRDGWDGWDGWQLGGRN